MERLKDNKVMFKLESKGDFTVYLEVYGKNKKLLCTLFEEFTTDNICLTRKDLAEIEEFMLNRSCIKEEHIDHTVTVIRQYDESCVVCRGE